MIKVALRSNPQMESTMNFVAEWFSHGEMKVLQGVSLLMSVCVREWQYKNIVKDTDDLMWEDLSEDWAKVRVGGRSKSCFVTSATAPKEVSVQIIRTSVRRRSVSALSSSQKRKWRALLYSEVSFGVCWMSGGYI